MHLGRNSFVFNDLLTNTPISTIMTNISTVIYYYTLYESSCQGNNVPQIRFFGYSECL